MTDLSWVSIFALAELSVGMVVLAAALYFILRLRAACKAVEVLLIALNHAAAQTMLLEHIPFWQRWSFLSGQSFRMRIDIGEDD